MPISNPTPSRPAVFGVYSGDNAASRQITTGFVPKLAFVFVNGSTAVLIMVPNASRHMDSASFIDCVATMYLHASDGFVVANPTYGFNAIGTDYYYWAIGA